MSQVRKRWTEDEVKILTEKYPYSTREEIKKLFPDRNPDSVQLKAGRLGIKKKISTVRNEWSSKEIEIIKEYYNSLANTELVKLLPNRSENAIVSQARILKLRKSYVEDREEWTDEDNSIFIEYYPTLTTKELIITFFPNRTKKQIDDKAYRLNLYKTQNAKNRANENKRELISLKMKGRVFSKETIRSMSLAAIKRFETGKHPSLGVKRSEETRQRISRAKISAGQWRGKSNPRHLDPLNGDRNGRWEGGITAESAKIRNSDEYFQWKISVFRRDKHTCQRCGSKRNNEAHHIKNFSTHLEDRFDIENGVTLCTFCHNPIRKGSFHNIYGTRDNNYEQLKEYLKGISWSIETRELIVV